MKNPYRNDEISGGHSQINTRKIKLYVSTLTEIFLNQKILNICEHTVKMAPRDSHIYSLLIETSVSVEICQLSFHVFICACVFVLLHFFGKI